MLVYQKIQHLLVILGNMNLLHAFENGGVAGISRLPDKVIETVISKLFFFDDRVFKVYKWREGSIGDFTHPVFRKDFFRDDFRWNEAMSPETYIRLGYVRQEGNQYVQVPESEAEDFFIEMRKINEKNVLYTLLQQGTVSTVDLQSLVKTTFERLDTLTESVRDEFSDIFSISLPEMHTQDMESTRDWIRMHDDSLFKTRAGEIAETLIRFIPSYAPFRAFDTKQYLASVDNHAGNILLEDDEVRFIDSMPPMRIWRSRSPLYILSRPATDVEVLIGKESADHMYAEYTKLRGEPVDASERAYCQSVAALIMALYRRSMGEEEVSDRYLSFSREKSGELGIFA